MSNALRGSSGWAPPPWDFHNEIGGGGASSFHATNADQSIECQTPNAEQLRKKSTDYQGRSYHILPITYRGALCSHFFRPVNTIHLAIIINPYIRTRLLIYNISSKSTIISQSHSYEAGSTDHPLTYEPGQLRMWDGKTRVLYQSLGQNRQDDTIIQMYQTERGRGYECLHWICYGLSNK